VRLTDEIAAYIYRILEQAEDGCADLQRNELAEKLGCVPSQINYVLTSRFTPEQGYLVESRRGGGGYIRIHRIRFGRGASLLMHLVNSIGEELSSSAARAIGDNLLDQGLLSVEASRLLEAALSDRGYRDVPVDKRDRLRAALMKQMLTSLIL
jgi:transcriptional regulator CtsR